MRSIVTGGGGFIGSHLCERLLKLGHKLIVIDNFSVGKKKNLESIKNKVSVIDADIRNYKKIINYFKNIDNVFHLAALADIVPSIEKPNDYYSTNVSGTFNVLQASIENKIKRFVYSASSSCYGVPKQYPTSETSEINPKYPYALTKRLGEELVVHFAKVYNLNATSLRFFNVYGPREPLKGEYAPVMGLFKRQKAAGLPLTIVGDGKQRRDFTHISDAVRANLLAATHINVTGPINIGTGRNYSINDLAVMIGGDRLYVAERVGETRETLADVTRARSELSWEAQVRLEDYLNEK
jgi:UDP-glucose 4-epimerase